MRTEIPYDSFWDELRKAVRRGGPFEINSRINNWRPSSFAATTQASFTPVTYTSSAFNESMRGMIQAGWDYASNGAPATASSNARTFRSELRRPLNIVTANGNLQAGETMERKQVRKLVSDDSPFAKCPACGNNVAPDLVHCDTCGKVMPE